MQYLVVVVITVTAGAGAAAAAIDGGALVEAILAPPIAAYIVVAATVAVAVTAGVDHRGMG
jgi:hypothetical protein